MRTSYGIGFLGVMITFCCNSVLSASLLHFDDKGEWEDAVSLFKTVTFTEVPQPAQITDQYSPLGITFWTLNFIHHSSAYVNDEFGLHGPNGIGFIFDSPQTWIAIDHPGSAQFLLLYEGEIVATSDLFLKSGAGHFSGVISSIPFDEVYIFKPQPPFSNNSIFIDDLHWGAIPTPGALGLFALAALGAYRRRRT